MTDQTSELLYMRAKLRLPGGVNSPVRAYQAVGRTPRFIQSAKGSHITDVDGNEMIDYVCSWGPGILGHADSRVIEKVKAACEEGLTFGAPTEREVEMAELLAQLVPSMEVSRLVSSGTEATKTYFTGIIFLLSFYLNYHSLILYSGQRKYSTLFYKKFRKDRKSSRTKC